jgi:AraC-like DNA-binding protein
MAAAAGLERRTFLRRFANATGMTPIEYCRAVRIARARELLECGNTPQKEIAQSLGYKDVASFARAFRKAVGSAPGAYRKRFGGKGISPADFAAKDGSRRKEHLFEAGSPDAAGYRDGNEAKAVPRPRPSKGRPGGSTAFPQTAGSGREGVTR